MDGFFKVHSVRPHGDASRLWSLGQDLNLRPSDYESEALPTELPKRVPAFAGLAAVNVF